MNWTRWHSFLTVVALCAEPTIESLQGQHLNGQTLWHAGGVFLLAMWMLLNKSPSNGQNAPDGSNANPTAGK